MTMKPREETVITLRQNYKRRCENCHNKPTVEGINDKGVIDIEASLCGPCFFGESRMLDPKEWNK